MALSPHLNPDQFAKTPRNTPYMQHFANAPTDELIDEYQGSYEGHVEFEARNNDSRRPYPPYKGPGSEMAAHDGIIGRGYIEEASHAWNEIQRRGDDLGPAWHPSNAEADIASIALSRQRPIADELRRGAERGFFNHNQHHVEAHEVDLERLAMTATKPKKGKR